MLLLLAVALVVAALLVPELRRDDGSLLPLAWTCVICALAFAVIVLAQGTRWQRSAAFLSLALVGQACALALINAPNYGVIQHYLPWRELLMSPVGLFLIGPVVQTGVVLHEALEWRKGQTSFPRLLTTWQMLILAAVVVMVAAYPTWDFAGYLVELGLALWIIIVNAGNLILVAANLPVDALEAWSQRIQSVTEPDGAANRPGPDWDRLFPWMVAFFVTVVAATISWAVFERIPHIADSVAYHFQAKYLSTGRIYLPVPPEFSAFAFNNLHVEGDKLWSYGFPGWPATLAIGMRLGVAWLVNPVLAGITILLLHALLSRLYDRRFAHATIALLAVSPWYLFVSGSFMTHTLSGVWALTAFLALVKARETRGLPWALVAGAAFGALFLTRPFEAIVLGVVAGLWILGLLDREARLRPAQIAGIVVAGLAVAGWIFPYNNALTGSPTATPHSVWASARWYPGGDRLGFGPDVGNMGWTHIDPLPGHGLPDIIINTVQNLFTANFELFGWAFGSLALVTMFVLWRRWKPADRLFLAIIFAIIFGYSFYWFSGGPDFGARYWYQILIPLVVLTVRAAEELRNRWIEAGAPPQAALRVPAFVAIASLIALLNVAPWRALGKYHDYRGLNASVGRLAKEHDFGHSLVFVRGNLKYDYRAAFVFNPPTFDSPGPLYARYGGPTARAELIRHYPDRTVWVIARSPVSENDFMVVAGPLTCADPAECVELTRLQR